MCSHHTTIKANNTTINVILTKYRQFRNYNITAYNL